MILLLNGHFGQHFVVRIPDTFPLDAGAHLLCAGITVYGPLRFYGLDKPGIHVGVVGLGGLGHVAVKFAKAMGVKVTVISTSPNKKKEALEHLGADSFLVSKCSDPKGGSCIPWNPTSSSEAHIDVLIKSDLPLMCRGLFVYCCMLWGRTKP